MSSRRCRSSRTHFKCIPHTWLIAVFSLLILTLVLPGNITAQSCCSLRGNVDCDPEGIIDIADLSRLIDYMFISFVPLCCDSAANTDADPDGIIDIADLSMLIDYMFISFTPLTPCSQSMSYAARDSVLTATGLHFDSLKKALPKLEAAQAMAAYLLTLPSFDTAGAADDGNCWARFKDDRLAIYVNNAGINISATSDAPPEPRLIANPNRLAIKSAAATNEWHLPKSNKFRYFNAMGSYAYFNTGFDVAGLMSNMGYKDAYTGSVQSLKTNVTDVGVFFAYGHGGYGVLRDNSKEFCIWTDDKLTTTNDSIYADDLREHRLVYMYAARDWDTQNNSIDEWHLGFTGQFVRKYMSFSENSLTFIASCSSATNSVFVNSFLTKGASLFAGFTDTWYAGWCRRASVTFFDRALGANSKLGGPWSSWNPPTETPPQRPFDWKSVFGWMQGQGLDFGDQSGAARLTFVTQSGNDSPCGPLAPSIATMFVHPYDQKLFLYGLFGDDPGGDGQVTVGGVPLAIESWGYSSNVQMDTIVCHIPDEGAGSAGDVQVKVREIKSNVTQLSRYKGKFRLIHETGDGRKYEVSLDLQFRVDLLGFRTEPAGTPTFNQPNYVVHADMASKGSDSCSGITVMGKVKVIWSGSTPTLHNNIDGTGDPKGFISGAWFDPQAYKMQLYMSGSVKDGITVTYDDGNGNISTTTQSFVFGLDTFDGKHDNFPSHVEISLGSDFSITAGSKSASVVTPSYSMAGYNLDKARIEWDQITCEYPPKEDTPRSAALFHMTGGTVEK